MMLQQSEAVFLVMVDPLRLKRLRSRMLQFKFFKV